MKRRIKIKGKFYEVEVLEIGKNLLRIIVDGQEYFLTQNENQQVLFVGKDEVFSISQKSKEEDKFYHLGNGKIIKSPINGIISKIFVKEGKIVKKNDSVAILSAMKMENEIIAESYGKVKEIRFKEGQQIKKDDIFIILE